MVTRKRTFLTCVAGCMAMCMMLPSLAFADTDGSTGHADGDKGDSGYTSRVVWTTGDNLGAATEQGVTNVLTKDLHGQLLDGSRAHIKTAISQASTSCIERYAQRHNADRNAQCRLFAVGAVQTDQDKTIANATGGLTQNDWLSAFAKETSGKTYSHNGYTYSVKTPFSDNSRSIASLVHDATTGGNKSLVVVVLSSDEPRGTYDLHVSTQADRPSDTRVGSQEPVRDTIYTSGGTSERVNADVFLHYEGNKYRSGTTVMKQTSLPSQGTTVSPEFTPADFDMPFWEEGSYWFDVHVAKQGLMNASVDTPDRDGLESWQIHPVPATHIDKKVDNNVSADSMHNVTHIQLSTAQGAYNVTFTDTIHTTNTYDVTGMSVHDLTTNSDVSDQYTEFIHMI